MDELAKRFADLADKYGPSAVEAARAAARTGAYSALVGSAEDLAISGALFIAGRFLWRKAGGVGSFDGEPLYFISGLAFFACGLAFFVGISNVVDPWTWAAIAHPDVWIAKRTLGL